MRSRHGIKDRQRRPSRSVQCPWQARLHFLALTNMWYSVFSGGAQIPPLPGLLTFFWMAKHSQASGWPMIEPSAVAFA